IQTFENVKNALDRPAKTAEIRARLLDILEEHRTPHGIQFDSRALLITGRRYGDSPLRAKLFPLSVNVGFWPSRHGWH
ncbi:hypothetical protein ACC695_40755, partial [Rhizobium ruizarguesonis]